ncbi:MAG: sirohydrochlorin cobaltochelatase [Oscillospiraceae bacterium]|nr:sirohydrochlorin cobaltochelatase [Oscillospiraceae bacterium]
MKQAVMLVSVGEGPGLRRLTDVLADSLPDVPVRRVRLGSSTADGAAELRQAVKHLRAEGVDGLTVQPLLLLPGREYDRLRAEVMHWQGDLKWLRVGLPLLACGEDVRRLALALAQWYTPGEGSVLLVGHGTAHPAGRFYDRIQRELMQLGRKDMKVALLHGGPGPEQLRPMLGSTVRLVPLMLEAGRHTAGDLAGEHPASWCARLAAAGCRAECCLHGLAEVPEVQVMFSEKLEAVMKEQR